ARREIGVSDACRDGLDRTFDADLPAQRLPVKQKRNLRVFGEFTALAAIEIGVENETFRAMSLQQHHADRWPPVRGRGGKRHRIRIIGLAGARFGVPGVEEGEGVGGHGPLIMRRAGGVEVESMDAELDRLSLYSHIPRAIGPSRPTSYRATGEKWQTPIP